MFGKLFGTEKAIEGVFKFADKMNFTPQERAAHVLQQMDKMGQFQIVQRIIVACIMAVWTFICLSIVACIWLQLDMRLEDFMDLIKQEFIYMPTSGVFLLYLFGGVMPKRKSK